MRTLLLFCFVLVAGCERLELTPDEVPPSDAGTAADGGLLPPPAVVSVPFDGGVRTTVRAVSSEAFVAFDLDRGVEVPFAEHRWDLAFRRQRVRLRGGVSGDGGVVAAPLVDAGFDAVTRAPDGGYLEDQPDGPDGNTEFDTVFDNAEVWYSYNVMTHVLTPRPIVYAIRSDEQRYFKLVIDGYYDAAGTPAVFSLRWAPIEAP
jgi:hypothetical protein